MDGRTDGRMDGHFSLSNIIRSTFGSRPKNMLRYTTDRLDRARPGLVALYDIWPGNRTGQFLQPRSPNMATEDGT